MNQNFGFMNIMAPKILTEFKDFTNRPLTPFREKCNVGDSMHLFTGLRTANCKKIGVGEVIFTEIWELSDAPINKVDAVNTRSPIPDYTWYGFALHDGFDSYEDFLNYFSNRKDKATIFKLFKFKLTERICPECGSMNFIINWKGSKKSGINIKKWICENCQQSWEREIWNYYSYCEDVY